VPTAAGTAVPLADLVLGIRNELQGVIEALAQPSARTVSAATPAEGFVQPDRVRLTLPVSFFLAGNVPLQSLPSDAASAIRTIAISRVAVQLHGETNPPPSTLQLGSIELEFVIAAKR
jgi:hypothetical protein